MFRKGRRLFSTGSILLMVVAILHTIGNFAPRPMDPPEAALDAALRAYHAPLGFWQPTGLQIMQCLALSMTVLLLWIGASNLSIAASRETSDAFVWRQGMLSAFAVAALAAGCAALRVPPPFLSFVVVDAFFLASLVGRPAA